MAAEVLGRLEVVLGGAVGSCFPLWARLCLRGSDLSLAGGDEALQ